MLTAYGKKLFVILKSHYYKNNQYSILLLMFVNNNYSSYKICLGHVEELMNFY